MRNPDETPALFFGSGGPASCSYVSALQAYRNFGAERTWAGFLTMSAIGPKAKMATTTARQRLRQDRTSRRRGRTNAIDP